MSEVEQLLAEARAEAKAAREECEESKAYHARQIRLLEERWEADKPPASAAANPTPSPTAAAPAPLPSHMSADKLLDHALRRSKALEKRLRAKDESIAHAAAKAREEADRTQREIGGYREQIADLKEELTDREQRLVSAEREHEERLASEMDALRGHAVQAVNQLNARMERMRKAYADNSSQGEVARLRREHAAEMAAARETWHAAREADEARERQQFEMWLAERDALAARLREQLEQVAGDASAREKALTAELGYLYDYVARLTTVLQSVDAGLYPVRERCGVRTFVLPEHVREELRVDESRAVSLRAQVRRLDAFVARHSLRCAPVPFLVGSPREALRADGAAGSPGAEMGAAVEIARLRGELGEAQRQNEDRRRALEDELASHETVEYIRALEDELAEHRQALLRERQRAKEARLASEAHSRLAGRARKG